MVWIDIGSTVCYFGWDVVGVRYPNLLVVIDYDCFYCSGSACYFYFGLGVDWGNWFSLDWLIG